MTSTPLPEQGGDVPTGLDEAVRTFSGYVRGENGFDELDFKEWLIEWHNKQTLELLDRLELSMRGKTIVDTAEGWQKFVKRHVFAAIEAERNKLKEKL